MCSEGLGLGDFLEQDKQNSSFLCSAIHSNVTSKERLQHCAERGRRGAPPSSVLVTLADKNVPCQDYYAVLYFKIKEL